MKSHSASILRLSPASHTNCMSWGVTSALGVTLGLLVYMDDFLIYAKTEEEHDRRVKEVLARLQKNRLAVSPDKCVWKTQEVEFLGYIIGREGMKMAEGKVEVVLGWKTPASLTEVQ